MPKILFCGKGGSGKSTLLALAALYMGETRDVLVVDADESNTGLARMMGLDPPEKSLMDFLGGRTSFRRQMGSRTGSDGVRAFFPGPDGSAGRLPAVCESARGRLRLTSVGKIEHAHEGCACPMGVLARKVLRNIPAGVDRWVLVDTEAGIEHIGRGLLEGMDAVVTVVDPSYDAVALAVKIMKLSAEDGRRCLVLINRVDGDTEPLLSGALAREGVTATGIFRNSPFIAESNLHARPLSVGSFREEIRKLTEALER
jgi:CO dehydrogenase maturation factor